ncbi:MAG: C-terminal binding protein [Clostridiales Family XIII bacterium]|jgi:D-3-phosphoglycerate dehydrogenase|nr:C-terminal binding protein [Clostridiales Family XIII bacterium]
MEKFKVVITDHAYDNLEEETRILHGIGAGIHAYQYREPADILRVAHDCDGLIVHNAKLPKAVIDGLTKCRVIARYSNGSDGTDIEAATGRGIVVANVRDYCNEEVALHCLALMLDLSRRLTGFDRRAHREGWYDWYKARPQIGQFRDAIVGVVGFGRIARLFVRLVGPLCRAVWVYSRYASAEDIASAGCVKKEFGQLVRGSDFISVHVPLDASTKGLFDGEVFSRMKRTAQIVNVARGGVLNERDLIRALQTGEIAGAALDVMEKEPPDIDNPLFQMDNVIITPHVGWYSDASQRILQRTTAENVAAVLTGKTPKFCVNSLPPAAD